MTGPTPELTRSSYLTLQGVIMLDSSSDHDEDDQAEDEDHDASDSTPFSDEASPLVGGQRRHTVSPRRSRSIILAWPSLSRAHSILHASFCSRTFLIRSDDERSRARPPRLLVSLRLRQGERRGEGREWPRRERSIRSLFLCFVDEMRTCEERTQGACGRAGTVEMAGSVSVRHLRNRLFSFA